MVLKGTLDCNGQEPQNEIRPKMKGRGTPGKILHEQREF
jgi:hypothetical protein